MSKELPENRALWRVRILVETEGGRRVWHESSLMTARAATAEQVLYTRDGIRTEVIVDSAAVAAINLKRRT